MTEYSTTQSNLLSSLKAGLNTYVLRLRQGWSDLCETPWVRRFLPSTRVRVLHEEQSSSFIVGMPGFELISSSGGGVDDKSKDFLAVTLPDSVFLQRQLEIPATSMEECYSAMQLEVESASPFEADQTVWGWRTRHVKPGVFTADLVISSRPLVREVLSPFRSKLSATPEVWVPLESGSGYVVLQGYGEKYRLRRQQRLMQHFLLMLCIATFFVLLLLATPIIQKRWQTVQAMHEQTELQVRSGTVTGLNARLNTMNDLREAIGPKIDNEPDVALLIDRISAIIPDGSWLEYFEFNPTSLRIAGYADDAIMLQRLLQEEQGFSNVRATASITRDNRLNKDRFTFDLDMKK